MTNDNKNLNWVGQLKTPQTQEVRYVETEDLYPDLGYEDISSSRGYGPGNKKNNKPEVNGQHLISTLNNKWGDKADFWDGEASGHEHNDWKICNVSSSAGISSGVGGMIASGDANYTTYRYNDGYGDLKIGSAALSGEAGLGTGGVTAKYSANADLVNVQVKGCQVNAGIDVGSGFTAGPGGVEVKAAGFGASVGKKIGVSTPIGGISYDFEEGCKQQ